MTHNEVGFCFFLLLFCFSHTHLHAFPPAADIKFSPKENSCEQTLLKASFSWLPFIINGTRFGGYQTKEKISSDLEGFQVDNCERQFYSRVVMLCFHYESVL